MHDKPLKGFPLEAVKRSQSSSKSKTPSQAIDRHRKEEGQKKERSEERNRTSLFMHPGRREAADPFLLGKFPCD
jgi:hypothetical protein